MLGDAGFDWCDLSAVKDVGDVEETGQTFLANACLKASEYAKKTGLWTLADDSGLEVDALDGKPGVTGARWAGAPAVPAQGDAANNQLLLRQLVDVPEDRPTASGSSARSLWPTRQELSGRPRHRVEGHIIREPRTNGFGYDPLFGLVDRGLTMAELWQPKTTSATVAAVRRMTPLLRMILNEEKAKR